MRQTLQQARKAASKTQKEIARIVGISEIHYRNIEAGTREGKGRIWDTLEAIFRIPQRQLREQTTKAAQTDGQTHKVK